MVINNERTDSRAGVVARSGNDRPLGRHVRRRSAATCRASTDCPSVSEQESAEAKRRPATQSNGVVVPVARVGVVRVVRIGMDRILVRIVRIRMRLPREGMAAGPVVVVQLTR